MKSGHWFAILAAILGGAGLLARKHGAPAVRKPLMITMWVLAIVAVAVGVALIVNGEA